MLGVNDYFDSCLRNGNTNIPSNPVQKAIAQKIDSATKEVVSTFIDRVEGAPEHTTRVAKLKAAPRTAGAYSHAKPLFRDVSPFEQTVVVKSWLEDTHIRKMHTFFMAQGEDEYVPVRVKPPQNKETTLMHVMLGSTRGNHKAPKYTDWANEDPTEDAQQKVFIDPLEALEIVRQPHFSGATILKGNAFTSSHINSAWRFGDEYACVESRGQSNNSLKKQKSAGLNACALVDEFADDTDPIAEELDISTEIRFEEYSDEGYADDLDTAVSPGKVLQAAEKAVVRNDDSDLTELIEKLVIAKIGVPQTPVLRQYIAQKLELYRT